MDKPAIADLDRDGPAVPLAHQPGASGHVPPVNANERDASVPEPGGGWSECFGEEVVNSS